MGVSGKWIRALVGLKKSDKSQSSEKDENVSLFLLLFQSHLFCQIKDDGCFCDQSLQLPFQQ